MKNQSPFFMVYRGIDLIRNVVFFYLLLFVVNEGSSAKWVDYGRILFYIGVFYSSVAIIVNWTSTKYLVDEQKIQKQTGLFTKKIQTIPFDQVEHKIVKRNWFHRLTNTVGIDYQLVDSSEIVKLEMISQTQLLDKYDEVKQDDSHLKGYPELQHDTNTNTTIFKPNKIQMIKASFTSLSFFLIIPFSITMYTRIDQYLNLEVHTVNFINRIQDDRGILILFIISLIVCSIMIGLIFTFLKYGNDEFLIKDETIFVKKGTLNTSKIAIEKHKIQGIMLKQTLLKKLFGLYELKLIFNEDDKSGMQSIYPYFSRKEVQLFVEEALPMYSLQQTMQRLPKQALVVRLVRGVVLLAVIWLLSFTIQKWLPFSFYWLAIALSLIVIAGVISSYLQTEFSIAGTFLHLKKGIFGNEWKILRFEKMIGLDMHSSFLQSSFRLGTICFKQYTNHVEEQYLRDISLESISALSRHYQYKTK